MERQGQQLIDDLRQHQAAADSTSLALPAVEPVAMPALVPTASSAVVLTAQAAAADTATPACPVLTAQPAPDPTLDKVKSPAVPVSKWAKRRARQRNNKAGSAGGSDSAGGHLVEAQYSTTANPAKAVPAYLSELTAVKLSSTNPVCPGLAAKTAKQLPSNGDKPTSMISALDGAGPNPAAAAKEQSAGPLAAAQLQDATTVVLAPSSAEDSLRAVLVTAKACATRLALTDAGRQGTVADTPATPAFEGTGIADIEAASSASAMLGIVHPHLAPVQPLHLDALAQTLASDNTASSQLHREPVQRRPASKNPSLVRSAARKKTHTSGAAKGDHAQLAQTVNSASSASQPITNPVSIFPP